MVIRNIQPYLTRRNLIAAAAVAAMLAITIFIVVSAYSRRAGNDAPPSRFVTVKAEKANVRAGPGKRIPNNAIEQNLVDHLRSWVPYVSRFGLLVLELHTIAPKLAALSPAATSAAEICGVLRLAGDCVLTKELVSANW